MAEFDFNLAPYHDRFDPDKNRNKVLFRPDRPLQQSELNELQSILDYNISKLGDSIFSDGAMQTGMSFSIDSVGKTIKVENGLVYLSGRIRPFQEQTISFTGIGVEKIGVRVQQRIIDSNMDPELLDKTQGVESYLSAGADRLEEVVMLTYNDESTPTIYEFSDGLLVLEPERPEFSMINHVLAQRTHDESGSYQVEGFKVYTEPHPTDDTLINLVVDSGTAYVLGYRIHKPNATRIPIRQSKEFREVLRETYTYETSVRKNRVSSDSVKDIIRVYARTESPVGGIQVSRGARDGRDALAAQYARINRDTVKVWTNVPDVTYVQNKDYTIIEENGVSFINWDTGLNGTEPAQGSTYFISFQYDRQMTRGTDYKITTEPKGAGLPGWDTYIDFNGMTGVKPVDKGTISVDYTYYLARADLVTLDSLGKFTVIEGQPNRTEIVTMPDHTDPTTLKIGNVLVYPNTTVSTAINDGIIRLRMEDLQKVKTRLEDVEYNQAIQSLEAVATAPEDPLSLRGVFVDGFVDLSRMDLNLSTVALSFDDASITLASSAPSDQMKEPKFLENESTAKVWGRLVTAPYKEIREIHQPIATEMLNVNPYMVYEKLGVLTLNPAADNWIETSTITVNGTTQNQVINFSTPSQFRAAGSPQGGTLQSVSSSVREQAIEFIRQREVNFEATNLWANTPNLSLTFDGQTVAITPTGTTLPGTIPGTVNSDATGRVTGKFMIPKGVRTGVREVVMRNDLNTAIATYRAQGTRRTVTQVINTTHTTVNVYDPLAQSFMFNQDRVVTSFDLYFATKSSKDNIIVQVRGMSEGGFPTQTIYAEKVLRPQDIKISADASVATNVKLDDPLMCNAGQDYALVVITDSADYHMWIGTSGQALIDNPARLATTHPYVAGSLFSSSNARTWTVHQSSDMKFSVYIAEFEEEGIVEFDVMNDLDSDMILLMSTFLTPQNTGCTWEVKVVAKEDVGIISIDSAPWQPLINYVEQSPKTEVIGLVKIRAIFKANRYMSPMMSLDDILFVNFISEVVGDYVSLNVDASEAPFNNIKLSYDAHLPGGTYVKPFYSVDGGATWKPFVSVPKTSRMSAEYTRYMYDERVSSTAINRQVKFKLELRADNRFVRPRVRRLTTVFKDEI